MALRPASDPDWADLYGPLCDFDVQMTSIITPSWDRKEAISAVYARRDVLRSDAAVGPIIFFCGNDDIALGALEGMRQMGLSAWKRQRI